MRRLPAAAVLAAALATPLAAQFTGNVHEVGPGESVQAAIDAAVDGDTILIRPGAPTEAIVVDAKSLVVTADSASVHATDSIEVKNLASGQFVVLRGLHARADFSLLGQFPPQFPPAVPAFLATSNDGPVLLEDCTLDGIPALQAGGIIFPVSFQSGREGARVTDSDAVTFVRCQIAAGSGSVMNIWTGALYGGDVGLRVGTGSRVFVYQSEVHGSDQDYDTGADGIRVGASAFVLLDSATVTGGDAGSDPNFPLCYRGGAGVFSGSPTSEVAVLDSQVAGGGHCTLSGGQPGLAFDPGGLGLGVFTFYGGSSRDLDMPTLVRGGESTMATYTGSPGDLVLLGASLAPTANELRVLQGVHHLAPLIGVIDLGIVPPSGSLALSWTAPPLGAGEPSVGFFLQTAHLEPGGAIQLSNPDFLLFLDPSF